MTTNTPDGAAVAQSVDALSVLRDLVKVRELKVSHAKAQHAFSTYVVSDPARSDAAIVECDQLSREICRLEAPAWNTASALASSTTPSPAGMAPNEYPETFGVTVQDAIDKALSLFDYRTTGDELTRARRLYYLTLENRDLIVGKSKIIELLKERATTPPTAPSGDVRKVLTIVQKLLADFGALKLEQGECHRMPGRRGLALELGLKAGEVARAVLAEVTSLASIPPANGGDVEADGWIVNTGAQPVADSTLVDTKWSDGFVIIGETAVDFGWDRDMIHITHYRLHKPQGNTAGSGSEG